MTSTADKKNSERQDENAKRAAQQQSEGNISRQMADNREVSASQTELQMMIDHSPRMSVQRREIERTFDMPVQRQGPEEEEELMRAKIAAQRAEIVDEELLQGKLGTVKLQSPEEKEGFKQGNFKSGTSDTVQAESAGSENKTGMPDHLKPGLENLSGLSMDGVRVHYNSSKPADINTHAFTQGKDIHIALGQERHLPHEGWHVVQQRQGRVKPTMQMEGKQINDDEVLEREAYLMGTRALDQQEPTRSNKHPHVQKFRFIRSNDSEHGQSAKGTGEIQRLTIKSGHETDGTKKIKEAAEEGGNKIRKVHEELQKMSESVDATKNNKVKEILDIYFRDTNHQKFKLNVSEMKKTWEDIDSTTSIIKTTDQEGDEKHKGFQFNTAGSANALAITRYGTVGPRIVIYYKGEEQPDANLIVTIIHELAHATNVEITDVAYSHSMLFPYLNDPDVGELPLRNAESYAYAIVHIYAKEQDVRPQELEVRSHGLTDDVDEKVIKVMAKIEMLTNLGRIDELYIKLIKRLATESDLQQIKESEFPYEISLHKFYSQYLGLPDDFSKINKKDVPSAILKIKLWNDRLSEIKESYNAMTGAKFLETKNEATEIGEWNDEVRIGKDFYKEDQPLHLLRIMSPYKDTVLEEIITACEGRIGTTLKGKPS